MSPHAWVCWHGFLLGWLQWLWIWGTSQFQGSLCTKLAELNLSLCAQMISWHCLWGLQRECAKFSCCAPSSSPLLSCVTLLCACMEIQCVCNPIHIICKRYFKPTRTIRAVSVSFLLTLIGVGFPIPLFLLIMKINQLNVMCLLLWLLILCFLCIVVCIITFITCFIIILSSWSIIILSPCAPIWPYYKMKLILFPGFLQWCSDRVQNVRTTNSTACPSNNSIACTTYNRATSRLYWCDTFCSRWFATCTHTTERY